MKRQHGRARDGKAGNEGTTYIQMAACSTLAHYKQGPSVIPIPPVLVVPNIVSVSLLLPGSDLPLVSYTVSFRDG